MQQDQPSEFPILTLKELISMNRKIRKNKKINVDLSGTKYNVIWEAMEKHFQWDCSDCAIDDWNLLWNDTYISEEDLRKMHPFQKINHFPGSYHLGRKNELGKNLRQMRKVYTEDYNFFPKTWLLPYQGEELRQHHIQQKGYKPVYIIKPEASCQGRGIFLSKKIDSLITGDSRYVVQEYIKNPLLIDGLKFDLRIYVLLKSVTPLKVFMYQEGLGRLATKAYSKPSKKNMSNMCMHLTNYAVNKRSKDFIFNTGDDSVGHKRSFSAVLMHLKNQGYDVQRIMMDIRQVIVKTLCSVQPYLAHLYRTCQPRDDQNEQCFEVFGFDVMLDDQLKPWLLEVNHTPSFSTDTELDLNIKRSLILDTLTLVNIKNKQRKQYFEQKRAQTFIKPQKKTQEERDQYTKQQDHYERQNLNGYMKIYPADDDPTKYEAYMESAKNLLNEWAGTVKQPLKKIIPPPPQVSANPPQRKASAPSKDTISTSNRRLIERPHSSVNPLQTTPRPPTTAQRGTFVATEKTQNHHSEAEGMNSSVSVVEADNSESPDHNGDIQRNVLTRPRKPYEFKALPPKPQSANLNNILRNQPRIAQQKDKRQTLVYPQQPNPWNQFENNPMQILHGIEHINFNYHQMIERNGYNLKSQLQSTLSSKNLKIKNGAQGAPSMETFVSPKIFTNITQSRKNDAANESFKIKKVNMVPIKNFNFQDKLTNLLNIQKE